MLNIRIEKTTTPKAKPADESKLGFGKVFTDHLSPLTRRMIQKRLSSISEGRVKTHYPMRFPRRK